MAKYPEMLRKATIILNEIPYVYLEEQEKIILKELNEFIAKHPDDSCLEEYCMLGD